MIHDTKHMIIKFLDIWRSNGTEQKVYKLTWILFSRQRAVHRILWNNVTNSDQCVRKIIWDWCRGWFRAGEEWNEERLLQTSRWKNTRASSSGDESGRDLLILWSTEVQHDGKEEIKDNSEMTRTCQIYVCVLKGFWSKASSKNYESRTTEVWVSNTGWYRHSHWSHRSRWCHTG